MATMNDIGGARRQRRISGSVDMAWPGKWTDNLFEYVAYLFVMVAGVVLVVGMFMNDFGYLYVAIPFAFAGALVLVQQHRSQRRLKSKAEDQRA